MKNFRNFYEKGNEKVWQKIQMREFKQKKERYLKRKGRQLEELHLEKLENSLTYHFQKSE